MKHTEEQIVEKAKVILKDFRGKYYSDECIDGTVYRENKNISFGKLKGKKHSTWIIGVKALADNEDLLFISDETGEPLYYQNFNTYTFDVEKDERGYFRVGLPRD